MNQSTHHFASVHYGCECCERYTDLYTPPPPLCECYSFHPGSCGPGCSITSPPPHHFSAIIRFQNAQCVILRWNTTFPQLFNFDTLGESNQHATPRLRIITIPSRAELIELSHPLFPHNSPRCNPPFPHNQHTIMGRMSGSLSPPVSA